MRSQASTGGPSEPSILDLFQSTGAWLHGHFRLSSGLHSSEYLQCALVLQYPSYAEQMGRQLAQVLRRLTNHAPISLVASPALGGIIIGHEVARALGSRFVFTERDSSGRMELRRGFRITPEETAVVVEDVVTTGGSTREVIEVLMADGARVLAAGSIIDRSGGQADAGVPREAVVTLNTVAHRPENCPLCKQGVPLSKPGSRQGA